MNGSVLGCGRLFRLCAGQWKPTLSTHGADSGTLLSIEYVPPPRVRFGRRYLYLRRGPGQENDDDWCKRKVPDYDKLMGRECH